MKLHGAATADTRISRWTAIPFYFIKSTSLSRHIESYCITYTGYFFIAGFITFCASVDFGRLGGSRPCPTRPFALVSAVPVALAWTHYALRGLYLSQKHRSFRQAHAADADRAHCVQSDVENTSYPSLPCSPNGTLVNHTP
ncbi:hypothetical protein NEOLEDRAFT_78342 [Neolentinus lepideus HHB14362 ss-1]|uniref:Uncharacterized protein n=1 Tax=Neolentinus lepideus HHB14362 ss-1 TaxID=1314782 RepID=A0A165N0L5_9AGAM|nr:hypothetical protein NEOLEDRAFT_78342 [Neolentinus lepideus HHB14362 ss-1]